MDLLGGYHSSSSSDGDEKQTKAAQAAAVGQQSRSTPELVSLRRPPPGALNAAPLPSVPLAVLRSQGALVTQGGGSSSAGAIVVASKTTANNGPIQGPVALHDPNDKTVSSTSYVEHIFYVFLQLETFNIMTYKQLNIAIVYIL